MPALRIVFAGTPGFAVPALEALITRHRPVAVLTQPDRRAGRGRKLRPGPVKQAAEAAGIEVLQPASLKPAAHREALAALRPDLLVTAAYGLLLPGRVLDLPRHGCWNLHASLLPRWRGASPIQQAILAGDPETGVTLMQMDRGLDTGPLLLARPTPIAAGETAGQLHDRLAALAAELVVDALERLEAGTLPAPRPQDEHLASHAPLIEKSDARIDWHQPAVQIERQVRAYNPWPIAFGEIAGQHLRIHAARAVALEHAQAPGTLIPDAPSASAIRVACRGGALDIEQLQAPGRRRVTAAAWLNAHPDWRRPPAAGNARA